MSSYTSPQRDSSGRRGSSVSRGRPLAGAFAGHRGNAQPGINTGPGAPPGRIVATDYPSSAPGNTSPVLRFASSSSSPPHSPSSPFSRPQHNGSQASLSSLGSDEGLGSARGDTDADNSMDDGMPAQSGYAASIVSEAAELFNPNLYLHAQEAWDQWRQIRGPEHDDEEQPGVSESTFSRQEQMSERASLLSSSLAQRPRYGVAPPVPHPNESAVSSVRHREAMLSAIAEAPVPGEATMRDAMKTADIGGTPGSNLGLILIAISQLCYSIMNLFVTLLDERPETRSISALEIVFVECFVIWIGATVAMLLFKTPHVFLGPPGTRLLLLARGVFGFLSTLFLYISLQNLSLSDATSITFLGPLFTGATAAVLLGEPFSVREAVAGVGSLLGVLLIAKPSALFGDNSSSKIPSSGGGDTPPIDDDDQSSGRASNHVVGIVVALLGVASMSGAWISLRKIGRSASTYHSIAYFSLCSWGLSLVGMIATREPFVIPTSWTAMFLLITVGLFSLLAQVFQTVGLQRETAGRAATMSYLQILFATAFQVLVVGTPLEFLSILGSVLILANGAWVASTKTGDSVAMH
ncbi:unnamed protein product [Jaminaea pallidilutea]